MRPETYGYTFSDAEMKGLVAYAPERQQYLWESRCFIEKRGERAELDKLLERLRNGCNGDYLFVNSFKDFMGGGLSEFAKNIADLKSTGVTIYSVTEPKLDYEDLEVMFGILSDITPWYLTNYWYGVAAVLNELGVGIKDICEHTPLEEADVDQAIADYKRDLADSE